MAVRVAIDLNLFEIIAGSSIPTSLDDLAEKTKANPDLIKRIIRLVTAIGFVKQTDPIHWEATPLTHALNIPPIKNWMIVHFDGRMETYAKFPTWLKKHDWKMSWTDEDNIWRDVHEGLSVWDYYAKYPEISAKFDSAMSIQESWPPEMAPPYPFLAENGDIKTDMDAVTLVDIGGGAGQAIGIIKKSYPLAPGRFILQDLEKSISAIPAGQAKEFGFEPMVHDFFTPQPVKGAKYYHLRRVLHDWNDEQCLKILANTKPAMDSAYSCLVIHEFVLPDVNAGPIEGFVDLVMMTTCDGKERTEGDWHALLGKAGFKIENIFKAEIGETAVIEASII